MKKSITIVDDEPNIGPSLRLILEGEGYSVSIFRSARSLRAERSIPVQMHSYSMSVCPTATASTCSDRCDRPVTEPRSS